MKINAFIIIALSLALGGCAHFPMFDCKTQDPSNPKVSVVSGKWLVVNQEPIVVPKGVRDFRITWELPRGTSYSFPKDGIVIDKGAEAFNCGVEKDAQRFTCTIRNFISTRYKYTIKVQDGDKPLPPLDPSIMPEA